MGYDALYDTGRNFFIKLLSGIPLVECLIVVMDGMDVTNNNNIKYLSTQTLQSQHLRLQYTHEQRQLQLPIV